MNDMKQFNWIESNNQNHPKIPFPYQYSTKNITSKLIQ